MRFIFLILVLSMCLPSKGMANLSEKEINLIDEYESAKSLASKNDSAAMLYAFLIYYYSSPLLDNKADEAIKLLKDSARLGNAVAQYNMGFLMLNGDVFEKDVERAIQWLEISADNGYVKSKVLLGTFYINRFHLDRKESSNYFLSQKWFKEAALSGDLAAMKMYALGILAFESSKSGEAIEWLLKAASLNHVDSMRYLGRYYELEYDKRKSIGDLERAEKWYMSASDLGDAASIEWLQKHSKKNGLGDNLLEKPNRE